MPSSATQTVLLPGDAVPSADLPIPSSSSASLKLGPGLSHKPPSTVVASVAGTLHTDARKHAVWIENNTGRYIPRPNDLVLAIVTKSLSESFNCSINPYSPPATLSHLAFENVSKKTRPQLPAGSLVYARIVSSVAHNKFQEPELVCYNPSSGKSEGLGELKGGMVFDVSLEMSRRLLLGKTKDEGGLVVLDVLAKMWPFEAAVGRNGRVWVEANDVRRTLCVGNCLKETDERGLGVGEQEKLVKRVARELVVE
ncbi:MAG: exosome non-catalytic core subunit rrp40 [Stictis urceolatum]|nr:exosome non-catalytic core subunit rrp40 [Stictis urceolata]